MPRRRIGQEELFAAEDRGSSLDGLLALIDWSEVAERLEVVHASAKGEASWPPLAMFRALLLSIWYDLSDPKLAEALDDRASFRRFCGFSRSEATPERTAFVRFRQALLAHGLEAALFEAITAQLKARAVRVKTGTIVDASVVASASEDDGEAAWSGHRSRKAVHGYKAHVGADADSALVERIAVTPGNRHDGRCGDLALPEAPGEVYADSGYRGEVFAAAVRAKGGTPRVVVTSVWCLPYEDPAEKLAAWNGPIHRIRGRIEKIFGTWKRSYGFRRMRWRGLAKAALQLSLTAIAYNLRRTANILAAA
ncbi:MAG TPA: IS5 family transposase [Caulobacteraceae bacterium]|nr:IS5 family transposase [Caulobacteraceae bacterium]